MTIRENLEGLTDEIHKLGEEIGLLEAELRPILHEGTEVSGASPSPEDVESEVSRIVTILTGDVERLRSYVLGIKNRLDL